MSGLLHPRTLALVTDLTLVSDQDELCNRVSSAVRGGVDLVQVRAKTLGTEEQVGLTSRLVGEVGKYARVVFNGSPEVAKASGAHGVHLPEKGISISNAKSLLGPTALVGRSVHSTAVAIQAQSDGADYVFFGTVFSTLSHPHGPFSGVKGISEVASALSIPVIGIGGITAENCRSVIDAGANGIAAITAIIGEHDSFSTSRRLHSMIMGTGSVGIKPESCNPAS